MPRPQKSATGPTSPPRRRATRRASSPRRARRTRAGGGRSTLRRRTRTRSRPRGSPSPRPRTRARAAVTRSTKRSARPCRRHGPPRRRPRPPTPRTAATCDSRVSIPSVSATIRYIRFHSIYPIRTWDSSQHVLAQVACLSSKTLSIAQSPTHTSLERDRTLKRAERKKLLTIERW